MTARSQNSTGKARIPDARTMESVIMKQYYDTIIDGINEAIRTKELDKILHCEILTPSILDVSILQYTYWMPNSDDLIVDIDISVDLEVRLEGSIEREIPCQFQVSLWFDTADGFQCECEGVNLPKDERQGDLWMLGQYLVPIIGKEEIERGADSIWQSYCPAAMEDSTFRTPQNLAKILGLTITRQHLYQKGSTQSILFFAEGEVTVVDDPAPKHGEESKTRTVVIPANTIVLNAAVSTHDDWSLCIYHECIHYLWHRMFYRLQEKHNSDDSLFEWIEMRLGKNRIPPNPLKWMEYQADRGAYALMMPEYAVKSVIEKIYQTFHNRDKIDGYYHNHAGWRAEAAIRGTAISFNLRKFRVKARMKQLGYTEAVGAMNYGDDGYITPFALSDEYRYQSGDNFVINRKRLSELYKSSEKFRKIMESGEYIYADGHLCMNDERCIRRTESGLRLTAWANTHVDLCCMMFSNVYETNQAKEYEFGMLNSEAGYNRMYNQFLDGSGERTAKERMAVQKDLMDHMPSPFPDALTYLMHGRITIEALAEQANLSMSTIKRLRSEEKLTYNLDHIIAICVAMHLPPWLSEALLDRAHLDVKRYGPFGYYREILDCYFMDDIPTVQAFLVENGFKVLSLCSE